MIDNKDVDYEGMSRHELLLLAWEALDKIEKLLSEKSVRLGGPTFTEWKEQQEGNNDSTL